MNKLSWAASVGAGVCLVALAQWITRPAEPVARDTPAALSAASLPVNAAPASAQPAAVEPTKAGPATSAATPSQPANRPKDLPEGMGSEGLGPHIQRAIEIGSAAELHRAAGWLGLCAGLKTLNELGDRARTEQWGGAESTKMLLDQLGRIERACQTVTPEQMSQRRPLAERLVALKWPGAVIDYESTLQRTKGVGYTPDMQQQLATWHRAAGLRGDEPSLFALADRGSRYGLAAAEARAWGHFIQRCYPVGLQAHKGSLTRDPFVFREAQPAWIQAYAAKGLPVPTVDAKVDGEARNLAASWACPTPAN